MILSDYLRDVKCTYTLNAESILDPSCVASLVLAYINYIDLVTTGLEFFFIQCSFWLRLIFLTLCQQA